MGHFPRFPHTSVPVPSTGAPKAEPVAEARRCELHLAAHRSCSGGAEEGLCRGTGGWVNFWRPMEVVFQIFHGKFWEIVDHTANYDGLLWFIVV